MSKAKKIIIYVLIGVIVLSVSFFILLIMAFWDEADVEPDNSESSIVEEVTVETIETDNIVVETEDISIKEAEEMETTGLSGTTKDGSTWVEVDENTLIVKTETTAKKVTIKENKKNSDKAKVASVVTAKQSKQETGYDKKKKNWSTDSKYYYYKKADCIITYPAVFTYVGEQDKTGILVFCDPRTNAYIHVSIEKNPYTCMDEVESLMKNTEYNKVLASGNDWITAFGDQNKDESVFSYIGLGNKYLVTCDMVYEKSDNFVYDDLSKLLKVEFVGDGVWVSTEGAETVGKTSALAGGSYDPALYPTSYYMSDMKCAVYYPNIFTKIYDDFGKKVYFTDPNTGVYFSVKKYETDLSLKEWSEKSGMDELEVTGEYTVKGRYVDDKGRHNIISVEIYSGYIYEAALRYTDEYAYIYDGVYNMLDIVVPNDEVSAVETQHIYFPTFTAFAEIPASFEEVDVNGDCHYYRDENNGMYLTLTFFENNGEGDEENLLDFFYVTGEDCDITLGEDMVKWHNEKGLFIGSVCDKFAALIEIEHPNAFNAYRSCLSKMMVQFSDEDEYESDAKKIRDELLGQTEEQVADFEHFVVNEGKETYVNSVDVLKNSPESFFNTMPYASEELAVDNVIVGDVNAMLFEFDDKYLNNLVDLLEDWYKDALEIISYQPISKNEEFYLVYTVEQINNIIPETYVIVNQTGPVTEVMYFYLDFEEDYKPGNCYFKEYDFNTYILDADLLIMDRICEQINGYLYELEAIQNMIANSYVCVEWVEVDVGTIYDTVGMDDVDSYYEWVPVYEVGHLSRGRFVVDEVYFSDPICGMFVLFDDGSFAQFCDGELEYFD